MRTYPRRTTLSLGNDPGVYTNISRDFVIFFLINGKALRCETQPVKPLIDPKVEVFEVQVCGNDQASKDVWTVELYADDATEMFYLRGEEGSGEWFVVYDFID